MRSTATPRAPWAMLVVVVVALALPWGAEGNIGGKHKKHYNERLRRERLAEAGIDPNSMSAVKVLTSGNFSEVVPHPSKYTVVEFYAPWSCDLDPEATPKCKHCQQLAPTWELFAQKVYKDPRLRAHVQVASCDADTHKDLGTAYGVQGFPTLLVFSPGKYGASVPTKMVVDHELEDLLRYTVEKLAKPPTKLRIYAFDLLAREFYLAEGDAALQRDIADRAGRSAEHFGGQKKYAADIYVKLMNKAIDKSNGTQAFFDEEFSRITRLLTGGQLKEDSVMDFFVRQTIIDSFRMEHKKPGVQGLPLDAQALRAQTEKEKQEEEEEEEEEEGDEADADPSDKEEL